MSRGNDAIPSWSGFNYQGKMAILCALQKVNSGAAITDFFLELEALEDFVMRKGKTATELYQVKAVLSCPKHRHYTYASKGDSVAQKLINHRADAGNLSAKCFLISAIEITDWNDGSNPFRNNIELYKYNGDVVSLTDISNHIKTEIRNYLTTHSILTTESEIEHIYGNLCLFLEDRVSSMHCQNNTCRQYTIPISDFVDITNNTTAAIRDEYAFRLKEEVYMFLSNSLTNAINEFCSVTCEEKDCNEGCVIHRLTEKFTSLRSITDYIAVINPSNTCWDSDLEYTSHATMDRIRDHIVYIFYKSKLAENVKIHADGIVFYSDLSNSKNHQVLPTLLDLGRANHKSLQTTLQSIQQNGRIRPSIAGNTLLALEASPLSSDCLTEGQINSAWTASLRRENTIYTLYEGTEIVSQDRLLEELKKL